MTLAFTSGSGQCVYSCISGIGAPLAVTILQWFGAFKKQAVGVEKWAALLSLKLLWKARRI